MKKKTPMLDRAYKPDFSDSRLELLLKSMITMKDLKREAKNGYLAGIKEVCDRLTEKKTCEPKDKAFEKYWIERLKVIL